MAEKVTPIIEIASENPELAPVIGIAYRGYQIANGLAQIEQKFRTTAEEGKRPSRFKRQFAD